MAFFLATGPRAVCALAKSGRASERHCPAAHREGLRPGAPAPQKTSRRRRPSSLRPGVPLATVLRLLARPPDFLDPLPGPLLRFRVVGAGAEPRGLADRL